MMNKLSLVIISLAAVLTSSCVKVANLNRIPDRVTMARESFAFVAIVKKDKDRQIVGSGSGVLVHNFVNKSIILTAGHLCKAPKDIGFDIYDKNGRAYKSIVIDNQYDDMHDSCLLQTERRLPYAPVPIARQPLRWGDKVWNLNAGTGYFLPEGKGKPGMIQIHTGFYSGLEPSFDKYVFTGISVHGGASGSMVLNSRGELVSIIVAYRARGFSRIHEVGYGEPLPKILKMLRKISYRFR